MVAFASKISKRRNARQKSYCLISFPVLFSFTEIKDGVPNNPDVMLQKLNPGYWFYNDEKKDIFGKERQLGFYAQNVHEAIGEEAAPIPEKFKDIDGNETSVTKPWGYYDRSVLAITVMSLKNALSTIEELKQRIAKLESN